jgi:predicted lipid-binding transport protein (Tim44 family)
VHKRSAKSVDLPPRGHLNRDPITKAPGAHPVEVAVGSALGGAAAGLAAGTLAGPIGTVVGAVVGGVAGGYGGKAVGEAIDPTTRAGRPAKAVTGRRKTAVAGRGRKGPRAKAASARTRATSTARGRAKAASTARTRGDDRTKRGPRDRARVNVNEPWEVNYWSKRFGVTPAQLRLAVRRAGPLAKDVRRQLAK